MPILTEDRIYEICYRILCSAGASDSHASTVAKHLVGANLAGHDSHGLIRIIQYVREIRAGELDARAEPEVVTENASIIQINGNNTFGQVVAKTATKLAMKKARQTGISLATMCNLGHTGRIGTYPEMAASEGMAAIMFTGAFGNHEQRGVNVAPYGGRERRLGTNPISMAFPRAFGGPILLDFATSTAAEGKLRVYRAREQKLPGEWVIDKNGIPSRDPNDYYDGGALLPLGGLDGGHKGYALSFMVSLFGSVIGGLGCSATGSYTSLATSSIVIIDLSRLGPIGDIQAQVEEVVAQVKNTPLMEGFDDVLYPGETEEMSRQEKRAEGVVVEQTTWNEVVEIARKCGLEENLMSLP